MNRTPRSDFENIRPLVTLRSSSLTSVKLIPLLIKPNPLNGELLPVGIIIVCAELANITEFTLVHPTKADVLIVATFVGMKIVP